LSVDVGSFAIFLFFTGEFILGKVGIEDGLPSGGKEYII
jgi:hypothetical protein